jgi:hypothetical protein
MQVTCPCTAKQLGHVQAGLLHCLVYIQCIADVSVIRTKHRYSHTAAVPSQHHHLVWWLQWLAAPWCVSDSPETPGHLLHS